MQKMGPFHVHPAAALFPLMDDPALDELVIHIREHGLQEPVVLDHTGAVLCDGRNRLRACARAGVKLMARRLSDQLVGEALVDWIVGTNLRRRHLDVGQRALLSLEIEKLYAVLARSAQRSHGGTAPGRPAKQVNGTLMAKMPEVLDRPQSLSRERAAAAVGVSPRAVQQAKALVRDAPDLVPQVQAGEMTLGAADTQRRARPATKVTPEPALGSRTLTLVTHEGQEVAYPQPKGKATFNATPGGEISWASWSWNPVTGCLHGCDYCYAREIATSSRTASAFPVGFTPLFHPERLAAPANTTVPESMRDDPASWRVFVCSMADLYGRWVPQEWIDEVHAATLASPQWQYLHLTKFPSRYPNLTFSPTAWVGTSVDEQKRVRIAQDAFAQIDGVKVRWLSLEPLKEPLRFTDLSMFDWVVIGAQTQTRQPDGVVPGFAPPFEWVARIVAQAREAKCRIHMKPNLLGRVGPDSPGMALLDEYPEV